MTALGASEDPLDHVVFAPAEALDARIPVIDDYGSFVTARLSAAQAARLASQGVELAPLRHALGRGDVAVAAIPPVLRAPADAPLQLVQFRGPVKAEWRAALDAHALAVYDYLPDDSFLARLAPAGAAQLRAMPEVRAVEPYHPAWKIAPALRDASGPQRVTALAFLDEPLADVLVALAATGAVPVDATTARLEHVVDLLATPEQLRAVARLDAVSWVEAARDEGSSDNAAASAITQGGAVGAWPLHAAGLDGSSQTVSVCDTGVNTELAGGFGLPGSLGRVMKMTHEMHDDPLARYLVYNAHLRPASELPTLPHRKVGLYYSPLENNITMGDSDDADGHGTHTAGTLAGDAPPYGERNGHDGVAYAAKLLVCDITTGFSFHILNDYENYWEPAYAHGARINSNSWGTSHTSAYTIPARQHDAYVWAHRDFLILRSMGNIPSAIRPEAVAKSAMGIGATENGPGLDNVASFSGIGPTQDGRVKPNVVAPGSCLVSSYLSGATSYQCIGGTSMSTPAVAGAAALVRDYFAKGYHPEGVADPAAARDVSAALVRAILQISGREVGGDRGAAGFPNHVQGWGRVALDDALYFAGDARRLQVLADEDQAATTGSLHTVTLEVAAGQPLRVMLAWSDWPGAAGANPALVNDLDLRVVDPLGAVLGAPDARNVEEAVYVADPVPGTYTVRVLGANVPQGPQPFVLVATGGLL
ncbi:MAG TPA: S8 family serine peptidase [Candidatus Thermoplasmatota archaeon]|nr:S8 family serine peptidase [Candidatus Thermoplasmatota archaeon]